MSTSVPRPRPPSKPTVPVLVLGLSPGRRTGLRAFPESAPVHQTRTIEEALTLYPRHSAEKTGTP